MYARSLFPKTLITQRKEKYEEQKQNPSAFPYNPPSLSPCKKTRWRACLHAICFLCPEQMHIPDLSLSRPSVVLVSEAAHCLSVPPLALNDLFAEGYICHFGLCLLHFFAFVFFSAAIL